MAKRSGAGEPRPANAVEPLVSRSPERRRGGSRRETSPRGAHLQRGCAGRFYGEFELFVCRLLDNLRGHFLVRDVSMAAASAARQPTTPARSSTARSAGRPGGKRAEASACDIALSFVSGYLSHSRLPLSPKRLKSFSRVAAARRIQMFALRCLELPYHSSPSFAAFSDDPGKRQFSIGMN